MCPDSLDGLERIVELADRFESDWRQGFHPRIEDFLGAFTGPHRPALLHNLMRIELEIRRKRGDSPRLEEYLERFPLDREVVVDGFADRSGEAGSDRSHAARPPCLTMPIVPGYRVVRLLGSGGFSEVWLAEDENLFNRPVALKMIRARTPPEKRRILLQALRSEAELLVSVRHPNLVQILRWLESEEDPGLVLQFIPGGSLADRLECEGPLDWRDAARYVADVAEGLVAVHARGIIHRDVKPANILWDSENDEAILTDLGVSVRLGEPTGPGGTIPYMAPEAFESRISPALDVYGLAATLFTLVTAEKPFSGTTIVELCRQVRRGLPDPDPRCARTPEFLERLIRAALAAAPDLRPSLGDFVSTLRRTLNQLLADTMAMKGRPSSHDVTTEPEPGVASDVSPPKTEPDASLERAVELRLIVSRRVGPNRYVPIAVTREPAAPAATRDMRRVPPPPDQVRLWTGDRVRVEAVSNRHGFITVFNVGPTGNLSLLYPDEPGLGGTFTAPIARANQTLQVQDVEMTPPAGRERLFAVWSRQPLPLRLDRLQCLVETTSKKSPASRPYVATRDMKRVQQSVEQLDPDEWKAVSLELDHAAPEPTPGAESSP